MNLGIDFHDTLSCAPEFFKGLIKGWQGKIYIVTGIPPSKEYEVIADLKDLGFEGLYDEILCGFEYDKNKMTLDHFRNMAKHKCDLVRKHDITVFFDDNPFYVNALKDEGVLVFQTILSKKYLKDFEKANAFFTSNLQEKQFDYLGKLKDKKMVRKT